MASKGNFLSNSLKFFFSGTAGQILKLFHRNVPCVTLFKVILEILIHQMAVVHGGFLHYAHEEILILKLWSDFEIISYECSLGDPFQNSWLNFDQSINMILVNGGYLHYTNMKKFL